MSLVFRQPISFLLAVLILVFFSFCCHGQKSTRVEVGETMEEYLVENHIEEIENMIHKLASSRSFLDQFVDLEEKNLSHPLKIKRNDIRVGEDIDVSVIHLTEHQTFTMILVPISIYSLAIYDTLLFSVLEVSDSWLEREFPYSNYADEEIKSSLLTLKNHELLTNHLYSRALKQSRVDIGKVKVNLKESYISMSSIQEHISDLETEEKRMVRNHWGLLKKAFTHVVDLNVEFNIYVFGFNDMEVLCSNKRGDFTVRITPENIFTRHHFLSD